MEQNEQLLQELYKNVKMGGDSIVDLLDRVSDGKLHGEMTSELTEYRKYADRTREQMKTIGVKPEEISPLAKAGAKAGMVFNTMLDVTTSHIAEMMINGATMGIINLEKQLNGNDCSGEPKALADEVLRFEKSTVERLETYL